MVFTGAYIRYALGTWDSTYETYCQTDTSAPDYGTCYNTIGRVYFVQSDTTTYPIGSLPCEIAGNCTRFTTKEWFYTFTIVDNSSVRKQILLYFVRSKHHTNAITLNCGSFFIGTESVAYPDNVYMADFISRSPTLARLATSGRCDAYDPITNSIFKISNQTVGYRINMEYYPNALGLKIIGGFFNEMRNNTFFAVFAIIGYALEASPYLIMPLDYDEYLAYNELRNTVGWSVNGVDQPGWNADDIISILKELFPDRAWAVFDDRQYVLYLYNLTPDYVPDWMVDKLAPISMKVLKPPSVSSVAKAWLDVLNQRNAYNAPPNVEI